MTETLTCEECDNDWSRERKRGRKPKVCPDCDKRSTIASKPRRAKVNTGPTPAEAAAQRREYMKPDREIVTKLPGDDPDHVYISWWCESKIPMHKTCQSINNDTCVCACHNKEINNG